MLKGRKLNLAILALVFAEASAASQRPGGETSRSVHNHNAFSQASANMPLRQRLDFSVGNSFFRNPWVAAPASTAARDGLGPLLNTNACQNCHIKDGRGHAPASLSDNAVSLLVRLDQESRPTNSPAQANVPDPIYGGQIQDFALPGLKPEARVQIHYEPVMRKFADGSSVELRRPRLRLQQLAYGPLDPDTHMSARIAPPMIGLGLLQAIPEERLLQLADPEDSDGDGISGRVNRVWQQATQSTVIGRFGWKAGQPTLLQQNAAAFNGDMGLTSHVFVSENCTKQQRICHDTINGNDAEGTEVSRHILNQVTFYTGNLAVPTRRTPNAENVQSGERLFSEIGCHQCHAPSHRTAGDYHQAWLANQSIAPYTDLLLHDMGEELADHTREFNATGREWRTPPLWGIGLTKIVSGHEHYLHDGRARSLEEAILWHGGEALSSRKAYQQLPREQRQQLLAFVADL
ncbi:MAG: di-heme oxidoredictase family protein [Pseudomonadota bacterium]|nr:di-heme oxidoredictase family protein [Pseudomonadota bacterium]